MASGYILGIDTGGTYTDGVLLEYRTKEVLRDYKTFTTKEDLSLCISDCINGLGITDVSRIRLVCLSTTLATNAVVENKHAKTGLIRIGMERGDSYPVDIDIRVNGSIDIMGRETDYLDLDALRNQLLPLKGKLDTMAISGFASVKNPIHELRVKQMVGEILQIPAVCGHEMAQSLGYHERTMTAVLNAGLIPVICQLIRDTEEILARSCITAPIFIMKGDGHCIPVSFAKDYPVETIMSGPAASAVGGRELAGCTNGVIVDMGGTTTDIIVLRNDSVTLTEDGMRIGGWKTMVKAVSVHTYGLGGDSRLNIDSSGLFTFGPKKVIPLCQAASDSPHLLYEIRTHRRPSDYYITDYHDVDCVKFFRPENIGDAKLQDCDLALLDLIRTEPHSLSYLADQLNVDIDSFSMDLLLKLDLVQLISITPTDLLHVSGDYVQWNREASVAGLEILAEKAGISPQALMEKAADRFVYQVSYGILKSICDEEGFDSVPDSIDADAEFFIRRSIDPDEDSVLDCRLASRHPVIGVGAPAGIWIRRAANKIGAEFILPPYHHVANAVGAGVSDIRENMYVVIQYDQFLGLYAAHLPSERKTFKTLEEAKSAARDSLRLLGRDMARNMGLEDYEITLDEQDQFIRRAAHTQDNTFVKSVITMTLHQS